MHDDDMVPNVRSSKKEKPRNGDPKNLLECRPGEVVLLAVRVCRLHAGPGGGEDTDAYVNAWHREEKREIFELFNLPKAAKIPVDLVVDGKTRDEANRDGKIAAFAKIRHLLPHPDDVALKEDADALRKFNRLMVDLENE